MLKQLTSGLYTLGSGNMKLKQQLELYDKICREERKRFKAGYKKYGSKFLVEDLVQETVNEILDAFGYLIMMKMKRRINA